MKHSNPNMVPHVEQGMLRAEYLVAEDPLEAERVFLVHVAALEELHRLLENLHTGRFLPCSHQAYAQGFVASYPREDACDCGGTLYSTGNQCRETGIHETRCTECDFHDF